MTTEKIPLSTSELATKAKNRFKIFLNGKPKSYLQLSNMKYRIYTCTIDGDKIESFNNWNIKY